MGIRKTGASVLLALSTLAGCDSGGKSEPPEPCQLNDPRPECAPTPCAVNDPRPGCQSNVCQPGDTRPQCQPNTPCGVNDPRPECQGPDVPVCEPGDTRPECQGPIVVPGNGGLGDVCNVAADCESSLCVSLGTGVGESICSRRCSSNADCVDNTWECVTVDSTGGDDVRTCVPSGNCLDRDGDGYGIGAGCLGRDCDDNDSNTYPGAPEICDNKDNNCDSVVDDFTTDSRLPCDVEGAYGRCSIGETECVEGAIICRQLVQPGQIPETCNNVDDDCDDVVDNNIAAVGQACAPAGSACANGVMVCEPSRGIYCEGESDAGDDSLCDGLDNNCDGRIDEDVPGLGEVCQAGQGICASLGQRVCASDPTAPPVCNAVANTAAAGPEICDYQDNDCDGQVDEDFKTGNVYSKVETCGSCENNCNAFWTTEQLEGTTPICSVTGSTALCAFTCKSDWVDADGLESNGCELRPDAAAVYVKPANKGGNDVDTCGAWDTPCATINYGIGRAKATAGKTKVLVAEGIYREGVVLENGISVLGGHSALNFLRRPAEYVTVIYGTVAPTTWGGASSDTDSVAVFADAITSNTEISGFTIIAKDGGASGNSIGVFVRNSTSALMIQTNNIQAGAGGQGASGAVGTTQISSRDGDGAVGTDGAALTASNKPIDSCASSEHRAGGAGGARTCNGVDVSGGNGADGICPSYGEAGGSPEDGQGNPALTSTVRFGAAGFTAYGRGYYSFQLSSRCFPKPDKIDESFSKDGENGKPGDHGEGGQGASNATGTLTSYGMWRGAAGGAGADGAAGGGGGGGGAAHGTVQCANSDGSNGFTNCTGQYEIGAAGGGGGAGGCGGGAAGGGAGGGGSFAIFVSASSSTMVPSITGNTLARNFAGQGGNGGVGGRGGPGNNGAEGGAVQSSTWCPQAGRRGGDGGNGGAGGGGGGGAGGASFDVYIRGASSAGTIATSNTFAVPTSTNLGGAAGVGGGSAGTPGTNGVAGPNGQVSAQ